jgi:GNAT superfamily N-acetyltransferase
VRYVLRASVPSDFAFVFEVNRSTMRPLVEKLRGWDDDKERAEMHRFFEPGRDCIIVVSGQDAGHLRAEEEVTRTHLRMIALLPQWQGRGIGSDIVRDLMRSTHERGVPLTLWVSALNHGALRLYQRLGFEVVRSVNFGDKGIKFEMSVWPGTRSHIRHDHGASNRLQAVHFDLDRLAGDQQNVRAHP